MKTQRTLCAAVIVLVLAACGGSGNGDVTIATDDPPPGSPLGSRDSTATATGADLAVTGADRSLSAAGGNAVRAARDQ